MASAGDTPRADNARTKLMEEVGAQMDAIEADFGDDFEIESTVIVVRLKRPDGNMGVRVRRNPELANLEAVGLLSFAQDLLKAMGV